MSRSREENAGRNVEKVWMRQGHSSIIGSAPKPSSSSSSSLVTCRSFFVLGGDIAIAQGNYVHEEQEKAAYRPELTVDKRVFPGYPCLRSRSSFDM